MQCPVMTVDSGGRTGVLGTDGYYLGLDDGFEPDAEALLSVQGRMNSGALVGLGFGSGEKKMQNEKEPGQPSRPLRGQVLFRN